MCSFSSPSKPKAPPPPPPPPPPQPAPVGDVSPEVKAARRGEKRRAALTRGRSSTVLTGGLGVSDQASVGKKTLLGA